MKINTFFFNGLILSILLIFGCNEDSKSPTESSQKKTEPWLISENGNYPLWSADGQKISFLTYPSCMIQVDINGGSPDTLKIFAEDFNQYVTEAYLSPDNNYIAFSKQTTYRPALYLYDFSKDEYKSLLGSERNYYNFAWSVDCSKITCVSAGEICAVIKTNDNWLFEILNSAQDGGNPAWSHDGSQIAFNSGSYEIWTMNSDGSNPTQITNDGINKIMPCWSPDGTKIAFSNWPPPQEYAIGILNLSTGSIQQIVAEQSMALDPAWSPDGKYIIANSSQGIWGYPINE